MKNVLLILAILVSVSQIQAQLPRVKILATGGTIAGAGASAERAGYKAGALPIDELLSAVPQIHKVAQVTGEQISSVGSQDMTIDIWKKLATRINQIFANNEADAVVITHGTDTQEETSYFLDLTVPFKNAVVITGSMRPATGISADGPKNLYDAVTVAASPKSKGKGVLIVFNEGIYDGRDAVKVSTTKLNAFTSPNTGPLGQVYDGKVAYYTTNLREVNVGTPFKVTSDTKFPKVDIIYMYADASSDLINDAVKDGAKGLVIAGVGNGNFNKAYMDAIAAAVKKGVVVCRASRCVSGRVVLEDEVNDKELGTIVSDDLNPQKARVLLMLGLAQTNDKDQLQKYFFSY
ncbi:MAG: L-asparaginase 2 [Bacteroidetes bacterium]|nr:MAG: L-asparaginase 2 [Bacteroidota bacterium]